MRLNSLEDVLIDELQDLYGAEKQLVKALPKLAKVASHSELKQAFQQHIQQTQQQMERLEKVFESLGRQAKVKKCKAMEGLIEEGQDIVKEGKDAAALDAALITAAQKVEHYEIAGYGSARTHARRLGFEDAANMLQTTLDEEGETDRKLTALAESFINQEATHEGEGGSSARGGEV